MSKKNNSNDFKIIANTIFNKMCRFKTSKVEITNEKNYENNYIKGLKIIIFNLISNYYRKNNYIKSLYCFKSINYSSK